MICKKSTLFIVKDIKVKKVSIAFFFVFAISILGLMAQEINSNTTVLKEQFKLERGLSGVDTHNYELRLKQGEAIFAEVIQKNLDVVVTVFDSKGEKLQSYDGSGDVEKIEFTALATDSYRFEISVFKQRFSEGTYLLVVKDMLSLSENAKRLAKKEIPSKILLELWEDSLVDPGAIDRFLKSHQTYHIIESVDAQSPNMLVTYFCVPDAYTEYAMQSGGPDFMGLRFKQLGNTKLHFASHYVPKDARFNYGFNFFKLYKTGSNNEIQYRKMEHVYDGTLVMPDAPNQIYSKVNAEVPKGIVIDCSIFSSILNEDRKLTVYTPPNFNDKEAHNLIIIFDGESYGAKRSRNVPVPSSTILDNLHAANMIKPTIAILVWNMGKRNKDLISDSFSDFIGNELISWAREKYPISKKSKHIALAGSSRGGYAASFIAFNHSKKIGKVLSQSGSYWITGAENENHWMYPEKEGKLLKAYKKSKKLPLQFYLDVGLYDAGASMLGTNRAFRTILELKGYTIDYREFKGGHSYTNWRGTLAYGIVSLFGK